MPVSLAEKLLLGRSESGLLRSALLIIMDAVYGHSNGSDGLPEKLDDSQRAALDREETGRSGFVFVLGRLTVRCTCYRPLHVSMTEFRDLQKSLLDGGEGKKLLQMQPTSGRESREAPSL